MGEGTRALCVRVPEARADQAGGDADVAAGGQGSGTRGGNVPFDAAQLGELACPGWDALEDASGDGGLGDARHAYALCAPESRTPGPVRRDDGDWRGAEGKTGGGSSA